MLIIIGLFSMGNISHQSKNILSSIFSLNRYYIKLITTSCNFYKRQLY